MKITPKELKDYLNQCIMSCQYDMAKILELGVGTFDRGYLHIRGGEWAYKHILKIIEEGFAGENNLNDSGISANPANCIE